MYAYNIELYEAVTASGDRCLFAIGNGRTICIRDEGERTNPAKLLQALARQGMPVTEKDAVKAVADLLERRKPYEGPRPIDKPGHCGDVFGWPDGSVSVPKGHPEPVTIYEPQPHMFPQVGTVKSHHVSCAEPVKDQPILMFAMLLTLMAPVRTLTNPAEDALFEIAAPTTDLAVPHAMIASVTGGHQIDYAHQGLPFHEAAMPYGEYQPYDDHLMVAQGAELYFAARNNAWKGEGIRRLLSREMRSFTHPNVRARTLLVIGRSPLVKQVGEDSEIGQLLLQRMITLHVPADRPHGFFDKLPDDYRFASQWAQRLRQAAAGNRGVLYRRFINRLVNERAGDSSKLMAQIESDQAYFAKRVPHDQRDSRAVLIVETFGLIYATGRMAQRWKLLPPSWRVGPSLRHVYQTCYFAPPPAVPFEGELQGLLQHSEAVHIGLDKEEPEADVLAAATLVIDHGRRSIDVVIRPGYLDKYLRNGSKRLRDTDVRALMQRDGRHDGIKKRKITGDGTRLYVFRLPFDEASDRDDTTQ